tara:strand:- start:159 stop:530 length:372 start_codon:yes stop_codon:yes gene_type:complete
MTPKEVVLRGYQLFAEGDVNGLEKINHENALFMVNGDHKRSGEYKGFADFRDNFLAHLPNDFPNFNLEILHTVAEGNRVHVFVKYTADNLDAHGVHMFLVEDGLQKEFTIFDDSQKVAVAHGS